MNPAKIIFLIYPGFELLDLSGPTSVFATANALQKKVPPYDIICASAKGGAVSSSSGIATLSRAVEDIKPGKNDTLLVVGANKEYLLPACADRKTLNWLNQQAQNVQRYGSICTGAFVLGAAGLLSDKRVTTHWAGCDDFEKLFPQSCMSRDTLYINDGNLWTSAGVSTGIDMALELVSRDLGSSLAHEISRLLVVYSHRPGNQSQFSSLLQYQKNAGKEFAKLFSWIESHLDQPIKVEHLAEYMCMSERSFYRKFKDRFGLSPAKYLEQAKMSRAKALLESGQSITQAASACGFRSESAFRTRFEKHFGISPNLHRQLHRY